MAQKFFITTPIYYSNGVPHIGHAYSSLLADTIARFHRLNREEVRFSTGVDENSQKVVESAESQGMKVMDYADMMASKHQAVWDGIGIEYTDFIRTTEPRHRDFVQGVLQKSFDNGDIYEGMYEGLYCVGCEAFKKESDLVDGKCSDHPNKPLQHLKEKNYFFRLSKYQEKILEFYSSHPDFVKPRSRYNEIIEFVKGGLEDFSISRETNKFGIPLPFDSEQVTYVWYDALFNYLTVVQDDEKKWWPADMHIIGKDIVKFHGIYWLAMLWSAGYEAPKQLLTTGYFTVDGQKMSKTIGNVIDPVGYVAEYSRDMLALYLFTAFPIGEDGDFDREQAILTFNAKLSNNLGNLLNRFIALSLKLDGSIEGNVGKVGIDKIEQYFHLMDNHDLKSALEFAFEYASEINKYVDDMTPWKIAIETQEEKEKLENILFILISNLRKIALMLLPFFDSKMRELLQRISVNYDDTISFRENMEIDPVRFFVAEKGNPLYMRIDTNR
ncbi:MAG: methionine--tRNA ligase [Candidatus Gracilibacteria bacterium]|nr:methionine--tRNA ligase [Candidatus Gracilibacteria bacterium]